MATPVPHLSGSVCPDCHGTRHVATAAGWARCRCLAPLLDRQFIHPLLRPKQATDIPAAIQAEPPWTLDDRVVVAAPPAKGVFKGAVTPTTLTDFQFRAWRALIPYRESGLIYVAMDSFRIQEINFQRDEVYSSLLDLQDLHLLVLFLGLADVRNKDLPLYLTQVLTLRRQLARPTWVWSSMPLPAVAERFSPELRDILQEMQTHAA